MIDHHEPVRWGILATGRIAHSFATALKLLPDAEVVAVGSRRGESARAFAEEYGARAYDSYEGLVNDERVEVVYVATPHAMHLADVSLALDAGKHVLCEKPMAINVREAEELVEKARERNLFLMEGMWTLCIPLVRRLQSLVSSGDYGVARQVRADLGFVVDVPPDHRLLDPALGAGALLDMGVYPLTFARLFLGDPEKVTVAANVVGGVDLDAVIGMVHAGGATSSLSTSMTAHSSRSASIATDRGRFDVHAPFHHPDTATWTGLDGSTETIHEPRLGPGLAHEAIEVMRCLRAGETESPLVPLDETLAMMRLLDRLRGHIGVRYPADDPDRL